MVDLTKERIRRFYSLSKDLKFQDFMSWLEESLYEERVISDTELDTVKLRQGQGVRSNLQEILTTINDLARDVSELNNNQQE